MFLNSVILTLGEVLEATVILSSFLAISHRYEIKKTWSLWAIIGGILGSTLYGNFMGAISQWCDGLGQEISNALILFTIYALLALTIYKVIAIHKHQKDHHQQQNQQPSRHKRWCAIIMASITVFSISREGSEIFLFVSGFIHNQSLLFNVLTGVSLGAGVGFSVGAIIYFFLIQVPREYTLPFVLSILTLLGGGICIRASQLLIQADLLPSQQALWDSSFILSESSITGQLLNSVIGYEASPSLIELGVFGLALLGLGGLSFCCLNRLFKQSA